MNTQNHNKDLKYCVYCGIRNNNYKIGCEDCIKKMFKENQHRYYQRHRKEIIKRQIARQKSKFIFRE